MNWEQLINFSLEYFDVGHNGHDHVFRYKQGKLDIVKAKSHREAFNGDLGDFLGRIDHAKKKISLTKSYSTDPFGEEVKPDLLNDKHRDYVSKQLSKKFPTYSIHHFQSDIEFSSFDNFSGTIEDIDTGKKLPFWTNPSREQLGLIKAKIKREYPEYPHLRGIIDHETGKAHVWPANGPIHDEFKDQTGHGRGRHDQVYLTQLTGVPSLDRDKSFSPHDEQHMKIGTMLDRPLRPEFHNHPWVKNMGVTTNQEIKVI